MTFEEFLKAQPYFFNPNTIKLLNEMVDEEPYERIISKIDNYIKYTMILSQIHIDDTRYFNEVVSTLQKELITILFRTKDEEILNNKLEKFNSKAMNYLRSHLSLYMENAIEHFYNEEIPLFSVISHSFNSLIESAILRNIRRHPNRVYTYSIDLNIFKSLLRQSEILTMMLYSCVIGISDSAQSFIQVFTTADKPEEILSKPYYFIIKTMDALYKQFKPFIELSKVPKESK